VREPCRGTTQGTGPDRTASRGSSKAVKSPDIVEDGGGWVSNVKDGDVTQDREVTHNATVVTKGNNSTNS